MIRCKGIKKEKKQQMEGNSEVLFEITDVCQVYCF